MKWLAVVTLLAWAHGDLDERIAALDAQIARSPSDATLYFERARLLRLVGRHVPARRDLGAVARLSPGREGWALESARLHRAVGRPAEALAALEHAAASPAVFLERARALAALGRRGEAARAIGNALAAGAMPTPDLYLEQARLLAPQAPDAALDALTAGIVRLGAAPALIEELLRLDPGRRAALSVLVRLASEVP